ncbi:hypothetical protein [Picosynechococcus sp. PCC 73109]|uniref:hypothetical protein n=1 Tax=Picosynechococcus sp. PCC 73109 TaxID=374982 RepID=UPI000A71587C
MDKLFDFLEKVPSEYINGNNLKIVLLLFSALFLLSLGSFMFSVCIGNDTRLKFFDFIEIESTK